MRDSFVGALPYLVLILAVTATSYIQQLQISARNKSGTPINPQQAMLLKILPAFFAFISLTLPAGVVVYFLVSNLYRIAQQAYITRAFYRHDAERQAELEAKDKPELKGASSEPKAPVLPPAAKKAQAQAAKSGKPAPKPAPKGSGSSTPSARPKPKSSGMTARPAPRPPAADAGAGSDPPESAPPSSGSPPPNKKKKS
jgi:YidC/Oxa1 family membrane protein insertase